jgi:nicotinamide riboside kinase
MYAQSVVIAIDGPQASGKSSLAHGLCGRLRADGHHATVVQDPARTSLMVEEVILGSRARFDMTCELDLLATQIRDLLEAARRHQVAIVDKTFQNTIAYAEALETATTDYDREILRCARILAATLASAYDLILWCGDEYDENPSMDGLRAVVAGSQIDVALAIRQELAPFKARVVDVPLALNHDQRLRFAVRHALDTISGSRATETRDEDGH